jgi:hypothetical protein
MAKLPKVDVDAHYQEVGLLCTQWAYLEWLLELTLWWLLGLLNRPREGRIVSAGLPIEVLAKRVSDLAGMRITHPGELAIIDSVRVRIVEILDERNLAVHGVRSLQPDNTVLAAVARGKYKNDPQRMSLIRLGTLNAEVESILAELELLLFDKGVIEGVTAISRRRRFE